MSFVPVARPGTKGFLLLSRHGVPGWETGTKKVSQPGQIKVFVVVSLIDPNTNLFGSRGLNRYFGLKTIYYTNKEVSAMTSCMYVDRKSVV